MDVTAVTDSINKKQTNSSIKRSRSITTLNNTSKYQRITKNDSTVSVNKKIDVQNYFFHQRSFSDIKIKFNQDIIWCDKALLAAASPVLCEELLKMNSKDDLLIFNDIILDEFLLLLEFIYPIFNPEINEENISSLIKLSHRFQFNVLKHACQFYVIKYLSTIRHVFSKYHHHSTGDENESSGSYDLIEFHDGTCIDASDIILNLCQWIKIYFYEDNMIVLESITSILQQISVDNLNRIINSIDINDDIKVYIYKQRAEYLEEIHQTKHIA